MRRVKSLVERLRRNRALIVLLAISGTLLLAWSIAVPAWESSDEPQHYQYANYIHDHAALPPYSSSFLEAIQPPLYYALISPLAVDIPTPHQDVTTLANGQSVYPHYPRVISPTPSASPGNNAVHLARIETLLISLLAVFGVFATAREATGRARSGLLAGALLGLWPEFTFRGMTVSPDALLLSLAAVSTYFIVKGVKRGFTAYIVVALGLLGGLAIMTRISGCVILVAAAAAILTERHAPWRARIIHCAPLLLAVMVAGPWLIHNALAYGDPVGLQAIRIVEASAIDQHSLFAPYFLTVFPPVLFFSAIGLFGWTNIGLGPWQYLVYSILICGALAGVVRTLRVAPETRRLIVILTTIVVAAVATVVEFNLTFVQPQGRLLFPAFPALAVMGAIGLEATPGWFRRERVSILLVAGSMLVLQVVTLATLIVPAYSATT